MKNKNTFETLLPLNTKKLEYLKKIQENCSNIQFAWLSGYFWKMANNTSITCAKTIKKNIEEIVITIVSASQTGNSKLLSQHLHKYLLKNKINCKIFYASDYKFKKIHQEKIFILIISTQGEGEPPEEALSFHNFIMSKKAPKLDHLYYSIFGLGDISYNFFCQAGKDFDNRLHQLGGKRLLNRIDADIVYQDHYDQWSKELLASIKKILLEDNFSSISEKLHNCSNTSSIYTKNNPVLANISINQKITGRYSTKEIHHIEIDISNLNFFYEPGDALGIWYKNDISLVSEILQLCSIDASEKIMINDIKMSIFDVLISKYELTINNKNIVKKYAIFTDSVFLKKIVLDEIELQKYVIKTPLVVMLKNYPANISSQELISLLRPLTPRLYSISSSQKEEENEVHITVGVIKKSFSGKCYLGGSSGYLSKFLKPNDKVKIFLETNNNFRLPQDHNTPIIMIGPGTGIAPFRAFMQERDYKNAKGKNWLFFGNPNLSEDFLYQLEWQQYLKKGLLTKIDVAWSQDQKHKIYVQDKIKQNSQELWSWIKDGAYIYVCGNAAKMAKDVEKVLIDIICKNNNMNFEDSCDFLNSLRVQKRYQRDVY